MCEFISWLNVEKNGKKHVLYLDDKEVFTERSQEIMKGNKDNDFIGHHAIRNVMNLGEREGEQGEERNFWEPDRLPKELRPKLKDFAAFKDNFGKMFSEYAQEDDLQYIIAHAPENKDWKGLKEFCKQAMFNQLLKGVTTEELEITARHDRSIDELVKEAKFNGFVNTDVNDAHFKEKVGKREKKKAVLVCLNRYAKTEEVEEVIKYLKLSSGGVKDLLSVAIDHPKKQTQFPIVELSSDWGRESFRDVACLCRWGDGRELGLRWREYEWDGFCRFLAFRES